MVKRDGSFLPFFNEVLMDIYEYTGKVWYLHNEQNSV